MTGPASPEARPAAATAGTATDAATAGTATATADPAPLPFGTVTFLFTDIEGSTRLLAALGPAYEGILEDHRRRIRTAVAAAGGHEVSTEGDSLFVVFGAPSSAVAAAAQAQRALAEPWPDGIALRVRMGIHTGEATLAGRDYIGLEVHRAARIGAAGHGGQVLLSSATRSLVQDRLPEGVSLRDLGEHRLKDLARPERLAQLVIDGLANDFPPPRTLDATPNNLPVQLTSFVGRTRLLAEALALLGHSRLLTLTGPGGTGKTRLALEMAADVASDYPDGVFFVQLAALSDRSLVAPTIAAAMGVPLMGAGPPLEHLIETSRARRSLLVLDNFEQILPAAGDIGLLLRGTEFLKVLVTSRAPLRISGEQELPVPPMQLPDPRTVHGAQSLSMYDAVRLFIERALAARPDFQITNENAPAVAEITARLDGLPLAIELATARLRLLSPQAILARLGDRLSLLSGGARDLPERQQTLRAAIAWSYDLLEPPERDLFERLGVFMGGWSFAAAEALAADGRPLAMDAFDALGSLNEKSLIRAVDASHGDPCFMMLETIHAFATERLDLRPDAPDLRGAHARWFLGIAERAAHEIAKGERRDALERLEDDHDNLRAALSWFMVADLASAARLAGAMWRFWQMRGYIEEGRHRIEAIIAADDATHALEPNDRRRVLTAGGGIAYWQADTMRTYQLYTEAADLGRAHGTKKELADALYDLSFAPVPSDGLVEWAVVLATESPAIIAQAVALYRELGDQAGIARALWASANYRFFGGDPAGAERELEEALPLFRRLGDRFGTAWSLHELVLVETVTGRGDRAWEHAVQAIEMFRADGDMSGMTLLLIDFAGIAQALGDRQRALRLSAAAAAIAARTGTHLASHSWTSPPFPPVPKGPDNPGEQPWWEEGSRMELDDAVRYALDRPALKETP